MLSMKGQDKTYYEAPSIFIFEVKAEGVICTSGDVNASMNGTWEEEDA